MEKLLRMLLVDDEKLILRGLEETYDWESMGFEIVGTALDGDIALEMLDGTKPDVIMTDISMKRVSGLELMEEVRKRDISTEFVVLSAYRDFEYAQTAMRNGALHYLVKPLDEEELPRVMGEVYEKCIQKIQERESYVKWRTFLLDDRENFIQIMTRKYLDDGIGEEELKKVYTGLGMEEVLQRQFSVVCADLESSYQIIHHGGYNEKRHVLSMMLQNALKERYEIQYFSLPDGCQVYLLLLKEKLDGIPIRRIFWEIQKELGSIVVSSISNCYEGLQGMKKAYQEALEIYAVACEAGASGLSLEKGSQIAVKNRYSVDIEGQLLQSIRNADEKQLKAACEKFVYMIPDDENGMIYLHRLMSRVEFALAESDSLTEETRKSFENFYGYLYRFQLARLIDLAYKLLQEVVRQRQIRVSKTSETLLSDYIRQAEVYIDDHISDEELSIAQIAEQIHLNPVYFGRIFKSVCGISLKRYILNLRIERAKLLLSEGNCSITMVGSMVGIPNSSYFTKLFKESTGKLPSEYMKKEGFEA